MESLTDACRIINNGILYLLTCRRSRIDTDGVTGVNTGPLDMLHDSRNVYMLSVTDCIHFHFLTDDIFIYQNRCIMTDFLHSRCHIDTQVIIVVHDFHRTSP